MKNKYKRFGDVNGNAWVGDQNPIRAWKVECATCQSTDYIHCHGNNPESTWNRLSRQGWRLSVNAQEDECPDCVNKKKLARATGKEERKEQTEAERIKSMSAQKLAAAMSNGSGEYLKEAGTKARIAMAYLVEEMLIHKRMEIYETWDLIHLALRFWDINLDHSNWKTIRTQLRIAAFAPNFKEAAAAREELKRLLALVDEEREAAMRKKLDEEMAALPPPQPKTQVQKFEEKFPEKIVTKPEKPLPKRPDLPKPKPILTYEEQQHDDEPGWMRKARQRMG